MALILGTTAVAAKTTYPVVEASQSDCPTEGKGFYGQDAQFSGIGPSFTDNGDGTMRGNVTRLIWQKKPPEKRFGWADAGEGMNWEDAWVYAVTMNTAGYFGHDDWRCPVRRNGRRFFPCGRRLSPAQLCASPA